MQRDKIVDNAKGILISLVVFGHCLELSTLPYVRILHNFIYSFHMPVFIYLAGMMSNQQTTGKVGLSVMKGAVIPFIVFSFFYEMLWYQKTLSPYSHFMRDFAPFWIMWVCPGVLEDFCSSICCIQIPGNLQRSCRYRGVPAKCG